ncbi:MAG: hypothetical protein HYW95_00645 [Candidatus Wildermuthbacteria bacterium]|nr:hypothetical protein [Candidatus Wildermuthbacteria bacterium]
MNPKKKIFYLGVEGGATKSTAMLVDEREIAIAQNKGGPLNYHGIGIATTGKNLRQLLRPICKKANDAKIIAVLGLAGLDTEKDRGVYEKIVKAVLPSNSLWQVVNDAETALELRCQNDSMPRILAISGTGSSILGEYKGKKAKSIGWDYIFGDEGSGYEVGLKILKTAAKSWDGRNKKSILEKIVLQQTKIPTMEKLIAATYQRISQNPNATKQYIASFSQYLDQALKRNDWAAKQIRKETAQELVRGIEAVIRNLHIQKKAFCLGFMGSVWNMQGLKALVQKRIKQLYPKVQFSSNNDEGVWGAILLARKLSSSLY